MAVFKYKRLGQYKYFIDSNGQVRTSTESANSNDALEPISCTTLTASGAISGLSVTDGTFSVTGGAITGATGNISMFTNDSNFVASGDNVSDLVNDSGFITAVKNTVVDLGFPILADNDRIVVSVDIVDGAQIVAVQPDVPRNITITVTDADTSITAGTVTVAGEDVLGNAVSEVLDLAVALTLTGTKIFAKVDSVTVAGLTGADLTGDTLIVGVGNVIGLPSDISAVGAVKHVFLGAVRIDAPVVTAGSQVSGVDVSAGTYDGTPVKNIRVYYNPNL